MYKSSCCILVIEDNAGDFFIIEKLLNDDLENKFKLKHSTYLSSACDLLQQEQFNLILLDLNLPDSNGISTVSELRERDLNIPIIVLTGTDDEELAIQSLQQGVQDYLVKEELSSVILLKSIRYSLERYQLINKLQKSEKALQILNEELQEQVEQRTLTLKQKNEELKALLLKATTDHLTGIPNRYSLDDIIQQEWKNCVREKNPLSVIIIDIDFFKKYNDTYGHQQGDECLRKVAQTLYNTIQRPKDMLARYGGEEFLVVLPNTEENGAKNVAEQMRANVIDLKVLHKSSLVSEFVTISLGSATMIPNPNSELKQLINVADKALYLAKQKQRNCCVHLNVIIENQKQYH